MKTAEKITTAKMLMELDPVTDFARFQDCLPPMLRLQANLFGERIPSEAEEKTAVETFRSMYGGARSGFERRKTDRLPDDAARRRDDRTTQGTDTINPMQANFTRRKHDRDTDAMLDA